MTRQLLLALAPPAEPSLANFVVGRNSAAWSAVAEVVAADPRERIVYLWGTSGSGRSHLLRASVSAARDAGLDAAYVGDGDPASAKASPAGLLAVDDVESLEPQAQATLFDIFNRVRAEGGRLVAAGDRGPRELPLRDDLRTRLASGVAFQLQPLSDAEKADALARHASEQGIRLDRAVIGYLLAHVRRDMRTLVAVLDALDRVSLERKRPITLPLAREVLAASGEG